MSIDAGGLAQIMYNNGNNGFSSTGLGNGASGFGNRPRLNSKKLSVALPPSVNPISENQVDNPTPRTSRSHLLAGLRTQPRTPANAPFAQTHPQGLGASQWADPGYDAYDQGMPQNGTGFDLATQYAMNAARQMYSLPEQVLAPPSLCDQAQEMDPAVLQQMQLTSLYLAQRQQQLQQQLASLTASAQNMNMNPNMGFNSFQQTPMTPQTPQSMFGQQQIQSPIEVPGQPGVYLVYNPAIQGYSYVVDQNAQRTASMSPIQQPQGSSFNQPPTPSVSVTPPATDKPGFTRARSWTPPKLENPQQAIDEVEPLPPPSSMAFRRGHKKASSLYINPQADGVSNGAKTSNSAIFGSHRSVVPAGPMTGSFGPGAARAGEHPARQPRGPPPLEELTALPTSKHEGSKNFATRQRRRALDSLVKAGTSRRGISRSSTGTPVSEGEFNFSLGDDVEDDVSVGSNGSRKMSPIGTEMKEKRGSQGSDGYFGLSSASSSEGEDTGLYKQPPTPATPVTGGDRKMMMLGVLNAAEKRRSGVMA